MPDSISFKKNGSITSWLINLKRLFLDQWAIFLNEQLEKLSRQITDSPCFIRLSIKWDPRNPAPPVIRCFKTQIP